MPGSVTVSSALIALRIVSILRAMRAEETVTEPGIHVDDSEPLPAVCSVCEDERSNREEEGYASTEDELEIASVSSAVFFYMYILRISLRSPL